MPRRQWETDAKDGTSAVSNECRAFDGLFDEFLNSVEHIYDPREYSRQLLANDIDPSGRSMQSKYLRMRQANFQSGPT